MTTATAPPENVAEGVDFSTPERIREFAQNQFDTKLPRSLPELHPTVDVTAVPEGYSIRLAVSGEGFRGATAVEQVYPSKRLDSDSRVRSAIWHQHSRLLRNLKLIPLPPDEDE